MIIEMLLIGGAISLFANQNRSKKDIVNDYNYSGYRSSCYSTDEVIYYSYDDFKNSLNEYMYSLYYMRYRKKVRIKRNLHKLYLYLLKNNKRVPSFDEVVSEHWRRCRIAHNIQNIERDLQENSEKVLSRLIKSKVTNEKILVIENLYNLDRKDARKYSHLKGVIHEINPRMQYLLEDEKTRQLLDDSVKRAKDELTRRNYSHLNELSEFLENDISISIIDRLIGRSILDFSFSLENAKNIISSEINNKTKVTSLSGAENFFKPILRKRTII